jgi:drug/metabolite transporter (DMT)-like permease
MSYFSNSSLGSIYAILSGLSYGLLGYFGITITSTGISNFNMLFWRFLVSSIFMLVYILAFKRNLKIPKLSSILQIILAGLFFYSLSTWTFFESSRYIGTGQAMVIFFTYPAFVVLSNVALFKAKIEKLYYIAFLIIIFGMLLLIDLHEFSLDLFGIFLGILSSLAYTAYIIFNNRVKIDSYSSTLFVSIGCMIGFWFASINDSGITIPQGLDIWINIIFLGTISTAIGILLFLKSLEYITSEKASMLSVLEPVFTVIAGIILLGESATLIQYIGILFILSSALLIMFSKDRAI